MKTYSKHDYEYGDLVVLIYSNYTKIAKGDIGIVKECWEGFANIQFPNCSGAFPYAQFKPLPKGEFDE